MENSFSSSSRRFTELLQLFAIMLISQGVPSWNTFLDSRYYSGNGIEVAHPPSPGAVIIPTFDGLDGLRRPLPPGPVFDPSPPQNITTIKDGIALLNCIVYNIGNKTVSWIREADLHILTVAQYTYTADDRFEVIHTPSTNPHSWTLKINSVQPRDSGRYECQVNTHHTDTITFPVYLSVFVPTAHILGSSERFVDRGSTINLTCIINHNPASPTEIFWYHNDKVINYDNRDSRVSVITDRGPTTKTILLIHGVHDAATGTYSCVPSPAAKASVKIHILNGEKTGAMQTNVTCPRSSCNYSLLMLLFFISQLLWSKEI